MMSTTPALITVAHFRELEARPGVRLELRHGEVVEMTASKMKHWGIQERIRQILSEALGASGMAGMEFAFRPLPEHELCQADVAWIRWERYESIADDDNLRGAPDIVVEVLSPSISASEILDKKTVCLASGCGEFWLIDPKQGILEITRGDLGRQRQEITLRSGDNVTVGAREYSVDGILRGARSR